MEGVDRTDILRLHGLASQAAESRDYASVVPIAARARKVGEPLRSWFVCAVLALALGMAARAEAAPITGSIRFGGTLQPTDFTTTSSIDVASNLATLLTNPTQPFTANYAALNGGGAANYNDFSFNPLSGNVTPLWILTQGDVTYSFDLTNITSFTRSPSGIVISGFGTAFITGFEPTLANWSFSALAAGLFGLAASARRRVARSK